MNSNKKHKKLLSLHSGVVKDINEQLVLNLIQEHDSISSTNLVKMTGMRPSTVFNIIKELSARSFVKFYGKGESTVKGGKRPYIWTLNRDAAYVVGLDIEVGEMTSVILDLGGSIVAKKTVKHLTGKTVDELTSAIYDAVAQIISENHVPTEKILGLGIAFAGIVDYQNGIVIMSSVLPGMNFPLLEKLNRFAFPVMIENNANAAAIGLKWNTKDKSRQNYLTVLVEIDRNVSGLGIGIVIDGKLYRGASYCAGELYPHLPTLTEILSPIRSRFVEGEILKNHLSSFEMIDIHFLIDAARRGDSVAQKVFSMIGDEVGHTIAPAVALLNPDSLIITGDVTEMEHILLDTIRKVIDMKVLSITGNSLNITVDKHHHYAVAVGAASLILDDFFRVLP